MICSSNAFSISEHVATLAPSFQRGFTLGRNFADSDLVAITHVWVVMIFPRAQSLFTSAA